MSKSAIKLRFPTMAMHPRELSGAKDIYYTDMRMAVAHAIREFNVVDIFNFPESAKDAKLLKSIPSQEFSILFNHITDPLWQEAIQNKDFQDKLFLYIYTYWWDVTVNTKMVDRQAPYLHLFKQGVPPALKLKYKRIKEYCLYRDVMDESLVERRQAWFDYCDNMLEREEDPLSLEDVEFYEKAIEYWEGDVKKQKMVVEPLKTPYGTIAPKMVRRKFRDIRDTHIEWYNEWIITHPDVDLETYDGRCQLILDWSEERARKDVARLRKQLDIPEGGQ